MLLAQAGGSLRNAPARIRDAMDDAASQVPNDGLHVSAEQLLLFVGIAVIAALVAVAIVRRPARTRAFNPGGTPVMLAALAGAFCGLLTYALGFVAIVLAAPPPAMKGLGLDGALNYVLANVTLWELMFIAGGAVFGTVVARYRWRSMGLLSYVGLCVLVAGYLLYAFTSALPRVPAAQRPLSLVLLLAEAGSLTLVLVFAFYSLDVASRRRWSRLPEQVPWDPAQLPKVALQVPLFNEPYEVVRITVARLVAQDYPRDRFVVMVLDDSTDPVGRARLQALCERLGAQYVHRPDRRGYKAGALNYAMQCMPRDVELIGVVDADYWVEPEYLRSLVGHFANARLGFVQTPQDYRNIDESFLSRAYYDAEAYFYHAVLPSRNEENTIIFCGTMGLLRREALEGIGGWAEDQICEDAEVSVRLAAAGWDSLYVDRSFGKGLVPAVYEAYKKQFHRWAFGNVRMLVTHFPRIVRSRRMRWRQKFDFVAGNLHWFDGVFVTIIALSLLWVAYGDWRGQDVITHHQRELALLALVPIFLLVDGVTRIHLALARAVARRGRSLTFRDTLRVLGMWFAIKFTNMTAALKSLSGVKAPFVRTPKSPGGPMGRARSMVRALRLAKGETLMASMLLGMAAITLYRGARVLHGDRAQGAVLMSLWLVLYGLMFACAPIYAYLSYRTLRRAAAPAVQVQQHAFEVVRATVASAPAHVIAGPSSAAQLVITAPSERPPP
jgi:cellulose synthase/poly-beta-1,6-N-acetylglucosamine synthase-like glycosyltransferase